MESTARNMWKVVYDRKCGAIVMLSDLVEDGMVSHNTSLYSPFRNCSVIAISQTESKG